jgi:hypothetical protein
MSNQEKLQSLVHELYKNRSELKKKLETLLQSLQFSVTKSTPANNDSKSVVDGSAAFLVSHLSETHPINSSASLSTAADLMFSQSNQHVSKAHAANVTSLSVPKESTNVLVQSIMFQKAHHLLLQHESFIRHINTLKNKLTQLEKTTLHESHDVVSFEQKLTSLADNCIADTKLLAKLLMELAPHVLESSSSQSAQSTQQNCCYLCFQKLKPLCSDCVRRMRGKRDMIALKKYGNQLLQNKCTAIQSLIENEGLSKRLEYLKKYWQVSLKQQHCELLKKRIATLRHKIAVEQKANQQTKEQIEQQRKTVENATKIITEKRQRLREYFAPIIKEKTRRGDTLCNELATARRELVSDLLSIMPLHFNNDQMKIQLVNITLPAIGNYEAIEDKELLNATFGHVVHFVNLLAKYLCVHLPYKMKFCGSHSFLWKEDEGNRYLLSFSTNKDLKTALQLLNENILYLCYTQGLVFNDSDASQYTFINLWVLVTCPTLGRELPVMRTVSYESIFSQAKRIPIRSLATSRPQPSPLGSSSNETSLEIQLLQSLTEDSPKESQAPDVAEVNNNNDDLSDFVPVDYKAPLPQNEDEIRHWEQAHKDHNPHARKK